MPGTLDPKLGAYRPASAFFPTAFISLTIGPIAWWVTESFTKRISFVTSASHPADDQRGGRDHRRQRRPGAPRPAHALCSPSVPPVHAQDAEQTRRSQGVPRCVTTTTSRESNGCFRASSHVGQHRTPDRGRAKPRGDEDVDPADAGLKLYLPRRRRPAVGAGSASAGRRPDLTYTGRRTGARSRGRARFTTGARAPDPAATRRLPPGVDRRVDQPRAPRSSPGHRTRRQGPEAVPLPRGLEGALRVMKYERLIEFGEALPDLRRGIAADLRRRGLPARRSSRPWSTCSRPA